MKTLTIYLNEGVAPIFEGNQFSTTFATAEECKNFFDTNITPKTRKKGEVPLDFINFIFNIWEESFDKEVGMVPFRFSDKAAKLARCYEVHKSEIEQYAKDMKYTFQEISGTRSGFKINDIEILFGDGSIKGVRAKAGLEYEDVVASQIISLITKVAGQHAEGKLNAQQLATVVDDIDLKPMFDLYLSGALDDVLDMYIKNPDIDLTQIVVKSGTTNTRRNSHGELFNKEFNITSSDIEQVLKASGDIIADVTIKLKDPVYISVKMKAAQLSGVSFSQAMLLNDTFHKAVESHETYDEVKDTPDMVPFNNFCETLGLIPSDVYMKYRELYSGGMKNKDLQVSKTYNKKLLGTLIQKLIGGNYWYTKPGICQYVGYKDAKLEFDIEKATISKTGQNIYVDGKVNGVDCELIYRTSGGGIWPYRLFPKISVPELLKVMK